MSLSTGRVVEEHHRLFGMSLDGRGSSRDRWTDTRDHSFTIASLVRIYPGSGDAKLQ